MTPSHLTNFQKSDDGLCRCIVTFGKRRPRKVILTMNKSGRLWTEKKSMNDPLKPSASLLIKLGSVIVHQEEKASAKGHWMDQYALDAVRNDPEVVEWLEQMTKMAFLPVKR